MVVIEMTSTTASTTKGVFRQGHRALHDALQNELPHHQGGVDTLRQVSWPDKFKPRPIDKYDGPNPEGFIQVYHTIIEAMGGDDQVKSNDLLMTLSNVARSWLINFPECTVYNWDKLCAMFIGNFQGTYEHPSTAETMRTIKQKYHESL
jgi:hypothetical protein